MSIKFSMILTIILILLISFSYSVANEIKLTSNDGESHDEFGKSVSVSGDYAIVGAPRHDSKGSNSGAAYIIKYNGKNWHHEAKLISDSGMTHDYFGCSVSVSGNYAIVGAFGTDFGKGAAYIFRHKGNDWIQEAKLVAYDGLANDYFGYSVSISGDYAAVGAYRHDKKGDNSGAVYIFYRNNNSWVQQEKLTANDGSSEDRFGRSVSIFYENALGYVIAGAIHDDKKGKNSGSAYIFRKNKDRWIQDTKLTADDGTTDDFFGFSVSIFGHGTDYYALVGADEARGNNDNSGAAYVFKLNQSSNNWIQQEKLIANDGESSDFFGRTVSVSGYGGKWYAAIGADADDDKGKNAGAAYIFKLNGNHWEQDSKLTANDGESEDNFGWAVSLFRQEGKSHIIAGANASDDKGDDSGAVYLYDYADSTSGPNIDVSHDTLIITQSPQTVAARNQVLESRSEQSEADMACAKGLVIPEEVKSYWENNLRPPRRPRSKNLPDSIDWSSFDSPVKNQKSCGSCWAFAAVAMIENLVNQANLFTDQDLSEQTMISCSSGDCSGGWYWDAFNYIYKNGVPPESCYAYAASNGSCSNKCNEPNFLIKINSFTSSPGMWAEDHSVDDLKEALRNGPLCVAMRVPDDGSFNGKGYQGGIYDYDGGDISWNGNAHAVLLVGYDDVQQYFKVKNSWGDWWGEDGYFRISYDDVTDDVKFGSYACSVTGVFVTGELSKFTITNTGTENLIINNISADKSWLGFSLKNFPFTLRPDAQQAVTVSVSDWTGVAIPEEKGTINILSNDPDESQVSVKVIAKKGANTTNAVLSVSPDFQEVSEKSGTLIFHVSNMGYEEITWVAEIENSWLQIADESHDSDGGKIIINYEANPYVARIGTIRISSPEAETSVIAEIRQEGEISAPADLDKNGKIGIEDVILILKILTGVHTPTEISLDKVDINGDKRIGLEEAVYALECVSAQLTIDN